MELIIKQICIYKSPIKLKEPFITSLGPHYYSPNTLVVIETNNGIAGFGECSPFPPINGETIDTCFIVAQLLAKALLGKAPLDIEACSSVMDGTIYANASIKSAFDIALYDIASQQAGLPLYEFLGGKNNKQLQTDFTVSIGEPEKMAVDAKRIQDEGFPIIKVKLGGAKDKDVERIKLIREKVGMDILIRIDANQGWSVDTAIATLNALTAYDIQYCEEPIPRWEFMQLPKVREQTSILIMADESCCDHHDAKRLFDIDACDMFNIKLGKSSGIFKALKIIEIAEEASMDLQVGAFLESRLATTASAHLALVSDNIKYVDFDTPLMLSEDPVVGGVTYGDGGLVSVPDAVGLGASMDNEYLGGLECVVIR